MSILNAPALPATLTRRGILRIDRAGAAVAASVESLAEVETTAEGAATQAALAVATASDSADAAAIAVTNADAAIAAAASFPIADFLGTITSLSADPGNPATLSGSWWQIGVAGALSHSNAGSLVVEVGDRILCDGTAWIRYMTPPTYIPDQSITEAKYGSQSISRPKLASHLRQAIGEIEDAEDLLYSILDSGRRVLVGIRVADGAVELKLAPDKSQTLEIATIGGALHAVEDYDNYLWAMRDSSNRVLLGILKSDGSVIGKISSQEVASARGNRTDLGTRLSQSLTDYGLPKAGVWGEWFLRETRQRLRSITLGSSTQQLKIAAIGDSWTHNYTRWTGPATSQLRGEYGDAGPGWTGFSHPSNTGLINGNVDPSQVGLSLSGTWTPSYASTVSPDLGSLSSSTAGDKITITGPANCSAVSLYVVGASSGAVRYRWNGGSWNALSVAGSGLLISSLASVPASAWTLEIEVVSGTPNLCGLDIRKTTAGVVLHKLGSTGSRSSQWAAVDATGWQTGIAGLDPRLVIIMHGTNDQPVYTAATYKTHMAAIIDRVRAAVPYADILLVAPCENQRGEANLMSSYALAAYELAGQYSCAFLDLQPAFGLLPGDYASGSGRPWFNLDQVHPEPSTGGVAMVDAILRVLLSR